MAYEEIFTAPCLNELSQVQRLEPSLFANGPHSARPEKFDIQQRN
jgi:hypothetical protein